MLYEESVINHNDDDTLKITFENDMTNEYIILKRIFKYDLF